jgi:hypothetical protein
VAAVSCRWGWRTWLAWAAGCMVLYGVSLAAFLAAQAAGGHRTAGVAGFTAWYAAGIAAAAGIVTCLRGRR